MVANRKLTHYQVSRVEFCTSGKVDGIDASPGVEVHVLDRQVPMRVENRKPPLTLSFRAEQADFFLRVRSLNASACAVEESLCNFGIQV